jgi:diguanylate cyclase (GGDEF)-like protein/PAS domain S-box-containing protein
LTNEITVKTGTSIFSKVFFVRLVAVVLFINLFISALAGFFIHQSKIHYEANAAITTQNLARISAEYLNGVIDKIDLVLVIVAGEMERQFSSGRINAQILNSFISREKTHLLELEGIQIHDARGKIWFGVGDAAGNPENIADKDYFIKLRDTPNVKLVISRPGLGRSTGKWNIKLARRLNRPDGSFAGVVCSEVRLEHFLKVFASINLGENGSIALRNKDLTLIARYSKSEGLVSSTIGQKKVSKKLQSLVESGQNNVTYKATYPGDGIERTYTYLEISGDPLFVNVGLATKDYLAEWRSEAAKIIAAIFLFFISSLFVSRYIFKNWERQQLILMEHRESEECFRAVFENALVGSMLLTPDGNIVKVNLMMENLLGYMAEELIALNIKDISFPDDCEIDQDLYQGMLEGWRNFYQIEKRFVTNYGAVIWGMLSASAVRDYSGKPRYVAYMIEDISARKGAEEQLSYQSTHDGMTGLRNRAYFDDEFNRMKLGMSFPVSIIIIDLDGLKQVNDFQGHEAGDRLIMAAAMLMREALQENGLMARIGGDEFAILLPESNEEMVGSVVERLRKCQVDFNKRGNRQPVNFSVGTATAYSDDQLSNIWKQADDRMYAEKAMHKSAPKCCDDTNIIAELNL